MRTRYRFIERAGDLYIWQAHLPGDSRVDQITCSVDWFWRATTPNKEDGK